LRCCHDTDVATAIFFGFLALLFVLLMSGWPGLEKLEKRKARRSAIAVVPRGSDQSD
jgi:hypothetical protein